MKWILTSFILLFGLITIDGESFKWNILGAFLFSAPLLFQLARSEQIRIWAIWAGIFLVIQSVLSPFVLYQDFNTLPLNMRETIDVQGGLPGINGVQVISTDSKGFRTTKAVRYDDDSTFRIFAIGGSTTEEINLDDHKTWTHLLQEQLSRSLASEVEVINTGVSGLRARHHLATLKNIIPFHPDLVVFLVGINDWNVHVRKTLSDSGWKQEVADFRARYTLKNTILGTVLLLLKDLIAGDDAERSDKIRIERGEYYTHQRNSLGREIVLSFKPQDVAKDYKNTLQKMSNLCHKFKVDCLFVTQPTGYRENSSEEFRSGFWMTPPNEPYTLDMDSMIHIAALYNGFLIDFANENNHYSCDAASRLAPSYKNFYDDCHFNTEGTQNFGSIVHDCVKNSLKTSSRPEDN